MSAAEQLPPALRIALAEAIDQAANEKIAKLVAQGKLILVEPTEAFERFDRELGLAPRVKP